MMTIRNMEAFTLPNGDVEVAIQGEIPFVLEPHHIDFIDSYMDMMRQDFPEKFKALSLEYLASAKNRPYYRFLMVRRDLKCNMGALDNVLDIDAKGNFVPEFISCPMRGECKLWKIVCEAPRSNNLGDAEIAVLKEIVNGLNAAEISKKLFISIHTVNTHRQNMLRKLNLNNYGQLIDYYYTKQLNKDEKRN